MDRTLNRKSQLLSTCGGAVLALGGLLTTSLVPSATYAQAIQATPAVVQGSVVIDSSVPNLDTITVDGLNAVVDWTPDEISGTALTFLPSTGTVVFQSLPSAPSFAIINRILPSTNGDVALIDGTVISQLMGATGPVGPGGHVLFYSPTGLLIGPNASFDVGSLVLTTLAPDTASFTQFVSGTGPLLLTGIAGDTSAVQVDAAATIDATAEGSYFVVAAPQISHAGTALINGSTAYVAGQEITLAHDSGLFDITIPVGTIVTEPLTHTGTTGGPASSALVDNHVIYGVASGQTDPFITVFGGNLGFDPAVSALIENGVIILTANYNVGGLAVLNDETFTSVTSASVGEVAIDGAMVTSDTVVHASDFAGVFAFQNTTDFAGDLTVYARQSADISAGIGGSIHVAGDLLLSSNSSGVSGVNLNSPADLDGIAGAVVVSAVDGGTVSIDGNSEIFAIAEMGLDSGTLVAGSAFGGSADVFATNGGVITFGGTVDIDVSGYPVAQVAGYNSGGSADGGDILLRADGTGSQINAIGNASLLALGTAYDLTGPGDGNPAGTGQGGTVLVDALSLGLINLDGNLHLDISAVGSAAAGTAGGSANAGLIMVLATEGSTLDVAGSLTARGDALGGGSDVAEGGFASGGQTYIDANLSSDILAASVSVSSGAVGGNGLSGGNALANQLGVTIDGAGSSFSAGSFTFAANATGGSGTSGDGGVADGGNITLTAQAGGAFSSTGNFSATAQGTGGTSGSATGGLGSGGRINLRVDGGQFNMPLATMTLFGGGIGGAGNVGGDGIAGSVRLDIFNAGLLQVGGLFATAEARGGAGSAGNGGLASGEQEGNGEILVNVIGGSQLSAGGDAVLISRAIGGNGTNGNGGDAASGRVNLTGDGSTINFSGQTLISSTAIGGDGNVAGTGGNAVAGAVQLDLLGNSTFTFTQPGTEVRLLSLGQGGNGPTAGGDGQSGIVNAQITGGTATGVRLAVDSLATAGTNPANTAAGDATVGSATLRFIGGAIANIDVLHMNTIAAGFSTGVASGGTARLLVQDASTSLTVGEVDLQADVELPVGGTGTAGIFQYDVLSGGTLVVTNTMTGTAVDQNNPGFEAHDSRVQALGGQIRVATQGGFVSNGNITFDTALGGQIIGGTELANLTASITVISDGLLSITGDNGALASIASGSLFLSSADIDIGVGALLSASSLNLDSIATAAVAVFGGTTDGPGYTLVQDEANRLDGDAIFFSGAVTANTANYDVEIRDLDLFGSLNSSGAGSYGFYTPGSLQVTGQLQVVDADVEDTLSVGAGERLEILPPGGSIGIFDDNANDPGLAGTLSLFGGSIFAADANLLGIIRSNPDNPGLAALLTDSTGTITDGSFIFADRVEIGVGAYLITRNTGVGSDFSGIVVGPGGLLIRHELDFGPGIIRVVTFGARDNGDGTSTLNDDFFAIADFGTTTPADDYTAASTLNDCYIVLGQCGVLPSPDLELPITAIDYVEQIEPVSNPDVVEQVERETAFGMEFPLQLNPPPIGDQGIVTDRVTSGGDSATLGREEEE